MIPVSQEISDLKSEFEGGSSISVDFYSILRRAANKLLGNVNPETLNRRYPLYGGFGRNLWIYFCPPDVLVPSMIYSNDGRWKFAYRPRAQFYAKYEQDVFTIENINGAKFVVVRHREANRLSHTLNEMDSPDDFIGVPLAINDRDFLFKSAALEGTFPTTGFLQLSDELITNGNFTENADGWDGVI